MNSPSNNLKEQLITFFDDCLVFMDLPEATKQDNYKDLAQGVLNLILDTILASEEMQPPAGLWSRTWMAGFSTCKKQFKAMLEGLR